MIEVEGYKAFHGTMRIIPVTDKIKPFEITCDWLYKPQYGCWYGDGQSFDESVCEIVEEN